MPTTPCLQSRKPKPSSVNHRIEAQGPAVVKDILLHYSGTRYASKDSSNVGTIPENASYPGGYHFSPVNHSSSANSSTFGATYCRCCSSPVLTCVSVPVVVAPLGPTCPVAAANAGLALVPGRVVDFFFFFFFSVYVMLVD